ncbi:MAG: hypothetical protein MJK18_08550, partial [Bdellovibrionales bacterium]|nr:hypothetical protein [Bdellovibrionales bacterium]
MKNKLFHWLIFIPVAIIFLGCGNQNLPAEESCNFVVNKANRRVSWVRMPVQMYADDSLSWEQVEAVEYAMEVWNRQFDRDVLQLIGRTDQLPVPKLNSEGKVISDSYNGIYVVDQSVFVNSEGRDEQARASLSFRGDYIFEADILIDASEDFYIAEDENDRQDGKVEFISLMIHELG